MKCGVDATVGAGVRTAICAALLVFGASQGGTQTLEVLRNFDVRPIGPLSHVIKGSDGALYGTTETGGILGGTVFKVNENGSGLRTLHSFNLDDGGGSFPVAAPLEATDGALYGTTADGGATFVGIVFKVNKDGTGYVRLHEFGRTDGATPYGALAEGSDGALYGTTTEGGANDRGVIFKLNKDGTGFLKLRDFNGSDGDSPSAGLIAGSDGALYGTAGGGAYGYGVAFKLNTDGSGFETFHEFDETGSAGFLLEGSDGVLYGAGGGGGAYGEGVVYRLNKDGSGFLTLHDFNGSDGANPYAGLAGGSDGALYGTTRYGGDDPHSYGVVFGLQKDGTGFLKLHEFNSTDGRYPGRGRLVEGSDGALYGTAEGGGMQFGGFGVVFKVEKDGTGFTDVSGFRDNDGTFPYAGVVEGSDGALYGTTVNGGVWDTEGDGVVFRVNKDGTGFLKLLDLYHNIGINPYGGVVEGSDGALYGTAYGGVGGDGVVYKLEKDGSGFLQLHLFDYFDGAYPRGGILEGSDGTLYGTTSGGGDYGDGVVFKIAKDGTGYLPLHYFNEADGDQPYAGLIEGSDGALYGTTRDGGAHGFGVVFKLKQDGTGFQVLHDFDGSDGANPYAPLLEGSDGTLYGTTFDGGRYGYGAGFKLGHDGSDFLVIHDFDYPGGGTLYSGLLEGPDGALYGTTYNGGVAGAGVVFRLNKDGSGFRNLHDFDTRDGANPYGGLIRGADGALYGTTVFGGTGGGVVYRVQTGCEAGIQVAGGVHTPGRTLLVQVHLAHHRVKAVTVPWELRLIDARGQLLARHTTEPHTFKPGDVLDRDVEFRLPDDLASGTYTLELAISGMAGTKGATTTLRVVGVSQQ